MLFEGQTIKVDTHDGELAELRFERDNEAVNKLDALAFGELRRAINAIAASAAIRGVLITSAKDTFIVGADIFEFTSVFKWPEKDIEAFVGANSEIITALSDLPVPTVAAINGLALGGGFEVALAVDYRVCSPAMAAQCACRVWPVWSEVRSGSFQVRSRVLSRHFKRARSTLLWWRRNCARPPSLCSKWPSRSRPVGRPGGGA
jgi:1,4-dihydroxy-2-naphthoyl-CoA synthase